MLTPDIVDRLQELHPLNPTTARNTIDPVGSTKPIVINREILSACIKRLKREKALGIGFWSNELIMQLFKYNNNNLPFTNILLKLINRLLSGTLDIQSPYLFGKLLALQKGEKIRPICCSDPLMLLAGSCAMLFYKDKISELMEPIQLGVGVSGGVEIVVHAAVQFLNSLSDNHENILLALDVKNAFNSVDRRAIREQICTHFPSLLQYFDWTYGNPTKLFDGKGVYLFDSCCGVKQGDSMSAFWFSLATLPTLREVKNIFPDVTVLAIMDDVTLMGKDDDVLEAYEYLQKEWEKINLTLVPSKSVCVCDSENNQSIERITNLNIKTRDGHILLGAPVGTKHFEREHIQRKFATFTRTVDCIASLPIDLSIPLLRSCIITKPNYIIRCCHPENTIKSARDFDQIMSETLAKICVVHENIFDQYANVIRGLPAYLGGIGISKLSDISKAAYVSSHSAARVYITNYIPDFANKYKDHAMRAFLNNDHTDEVPILEPGEKHTEVTPKQSSLTKEIHQRTHTNLLSDLPDTQRVVFISNSSPGTCHWINSACLRSHQHKLHISEYYTALRYRLLLPFIDNDTAVHSRCCLDKENVGLNNIYHPIYCKQGTKARYERHQACVKAIGEAIAKFAKGRVLYELPLRAHGTNDPNPPRLDLHVSMGAAQYGIDFTCVSPGAPSYVTAAGPSTATEEAKAKKHTKYDALVGENPGMIFLPFVTHDTGHIDEEALKFIDKIFGLDTALPNPDPDLKRNRKYFLNTLRTNIIRGNHRIVDRFLRTYSSLPAFEDSHTASTPPTSPPLVVNSSGRSPISYT